ncbi:transport permease protein [Clostridia bacterium]|nr:transport permease protein [Clostridia bacterium]
MTTATLPISTLPVNGKIGLRQTIRNTLTMAYRALLKIKHTPDQLVDVLLQPILFTLMFTFIFGGAISGSIENYLPLLIPGILVQTIVSASLTTGVQLREDMEKGVFNRFKSLPMARIAPLAGALITDFVRYGIATSITFAMGFLLGYRPEAGALWVIAAGLLAMLSAWCVSWIFAFLGMIMRTAQSVQGVSFLILMPLTFMSNAFVPVETMPGFMQTIVRFNPVSHLVTAIRDMTNTGQIGPDFWLTLAGMAVIVLIFAPLTVNVYKRQA